MIAHDAEVLRLMAAYHRNPADRSVPSSAESHERWAEILEETANLLDRLVSLIGDGEPTKTT